MQFWIHSVLRDSYERDWECCRCVRYGSKADLAFELISVFADLRIFKYGSGRLLIHRTWLHDLLQCFISFQYLLDIVPTVGDCHKSLLAAGDLLKIEVFPREVTWPGPCRRLTARCFCTLKIKILILCFLKQPFCTLSGVHLLVQTIYNQKFIRVSSSEHRDWYQEFIDTRDKTAETIDRKRKVSPFLSHHEWGYCTRMDTNCMDPLKLRENKHFPLLKLMTI